MTRSSTRSPACHLRSKVHGQQGRRGTVDRHAIKPKSLPAASSNTILEASEAGWVGSKKGASVGSSSSG